LGEVQEFDEEFVITKKGVIDKDKFYLPRSKAGPSEKSIWIQGSTSYD